ncbi:hypothetical protein K7X08_032416 [Anisodus acutangulus]|uniref:Uncharacterized protein n=1 Tax=Anisodus acutangulus TaxID=402998 RepID=A0A9Q1RR77_9SOLA|nr:hypothetical protein K7X08_032416 [Anisodus acutangulus]
MDSDRLPGSGFEDYVRVDDGGNVRSISQGSDESVVEEERGVDEVSSLRCVSCWHRSRFCGILPRRRSRDQLLETPGCFLGVMLQVVWLYLHLII